MRTSHAGWVPHGPAAALGGRWGDLRGRPQPPSPPPLGGQRRGGRQVARVRWAPGVCAACTLRAPSQTSPSAACAPRGTRRPPPRPEPGRREPARGVEGGPALPKWPRRRGHRRAGRASVAPSARSPRSRPRARTPRPSRSVRPHPGPRAPPRSPDAHTTQRDARHAPGPARRAPGSRLLLGRRRLRTLRPSPASRVGVRAGSPPAPRRPPAALYPGPASGARGRRETGRRRERHKDGARSSGPRPPRSAPCRPPRAPHGPRPPGRRCLAVAPEPPRGRHLRVGRERTRRREESGCQATAAGHRPTTSPRAWRTGRAAGFLEVCPGANSRGRGSSARWKEGGARLTRVAPC